MDSVAVIVGVLAILLVVVLAIKALLWVGEDARRRGVRRVWLLQLLCALQFPWPFLMYYIVTRELDASGTPDGHDATKPAAIAATHLDAAVWR